MSRILTAYLERIFSTYIRGDVKIYWLQLHYSATSCSQLIGKAIHNSEMLAAFSLQPTVLNVDVSPYIDIFLDIGPLHTIQHNTRRIKPLTIA